MAPSPLNLSIDLDGDRIPAGVFDDIAATMVEEAIELRELREQIDNYECSATFVGRVLTRYGAGNEAVAERLALSITKLNIEPKTGRHTDRVLTARNQMQAFRQVFHDLVELAVELGADEHELLEQVREAVAARHTLKRVSTLEDMGITS